MQGNDKVCQWLFDTYQVQDVDLQLVVLRFIPTLCGIYLPRVTTCPDEPLAGIFYVSSQRLDEPFVISVNGRLVVFLSTEQF